MENRIKKAIGLINGGKVRRSAEATYQVDSGHVTYLVILDPPKYLCTCLWGRTELVDACSHAIAACGMAEIDLPLST